MTQRHHAVCCLWNELSDASHRQVVHGPTTYLQILCSAPKDSRIALSLTAVTVNERISCEELSHKLNHRTSIDQLIRCLVSHVKDWPAFCPIYVGIGSSIGITVSLNWNK